MVGMVWKGLGGFGRVWEGWGGVGRAPCYWEEGIFYNFFSGFAIDRSKKYMKAIENYIKIDAVDPQAAADNHPPPLVTMDRCLAPYNPPNPVK